MPVYVRVVSIEWFAIPNAGLFMHSDIAMVAFMSCDLHVDIVLTCRTCLRETCLEDTRLNHIISNDESESAMKPQKDKQTSELCYSDLCNAIHGAVHDIRVRRERQKVKEQLE
jgi:hypothetical protein